MKKDENEKNNEKSHQPGEIEPIVDLVGYRVWKDENTSAVFSREQEGQAIILSELLKLAQKAEE